MGEEGEPCVVQLFGFRAVLALSRLCRQGHPPPEGTAGQRAPTRMGLQGSRRSTGRGAPTARVLRTVGCRTCPCSLSPTHSPCREDLRMKVMETLMKVFVRPSCGCGCLPGLGRAVFRHKRLCQYLVGTHLSGRRLAHTFVCVPLHG